MSQQGLFSAAPKPVKAVKPSLDEVRAALVDCWLQVRIHISPARFLATIAGHEIECCLRSWSELEAIWRAYRDEKATARWAGLQEWVRVNGVPSEAIGWDPTSGNTINPEEMAHVPDDIADADALICLARQNANPLADHPEIEAQLRAAGWNLP